MKLKYIPPITKDGKKQHVGIVCKNRDTLIGSILTTQSLLESLSEYMELTDEFLSHFDPGLDSTRFNNILEDGLDATGMTPEEIHENVQGRIDKIFHEEGSHPENKNEILEPGVFSTDCENCGNFVRWNSIKEIPEETFRCDICDRVLIHYIHLDDEDIEFDDGK